MMRKILIVTFICFHLISSAQVAGYMGKRCVIGYENYFFIALKGPVPYNYGSKSEFSPGLNATHCLNFDYATRSRTNFCLSLQYLRTAIAYRGGSGFFSSGEDYPYPEQSKYTGGSSNPILLSSINVGLGFKFFRSGFIAPVGRYQKIELLIMFETVKYDKNEFVKIDPNSSYYNDVIPAVIGKGTYNYRNFAFTYAIGKQKILSDKFVLDYGIRMGVTPAVVPAFLFGSDNATTMESMLKADSQLRMFRQQLFNFRLGLGFLAF